MSNSIYPMKVAVVSGGTKGIGKAICLILLENNCKVYTSARTIDPNFSHKNLIQFPSDLSTKQGVISFSEFVLGQEKVIDILINNVGVFVPGKLMDEEEGSFEKQINTNLSSSYHLTRQSINAIRKSSKPYIFNICSTASITPYLNGG